VGPGKRPFHTIIPAFLTKDGQPVMSFGVMGGDMQPQGHLQTLVRMLDYRQQPQAACDAPRWRFAAGIVNNEQGMPEATAQGLRDLGHRVRAVCRQLPGLRRRPVHLAPGRPGGRRLCRRQRPAPRRPGGRIIVKLAYRHGVDAVTVLMYRMLFALPLFALLAWWGGRGRSALKRSDWLAVLGLGFCGYYLASFLDFVGLQYVSASLERLVLYLNPTLVLLLGWALFGRTVRPRQLLAMAVSYAGIALAFGHELRFDGARVGASLKGAALVFASALSYAVYLVASGQVVSRIGSLRLTGLATSVACVLCIGQFALLKPLEAAVVPEPVIWLSVLNAVACTFVPVLAVMLALERVGAAVAAQAGMVGPLATVALGVTLLGEPLNGWIIAGTAVVLAGVWLLARSR
jgi:drug/metabolite transporter (DMT)-like permease